MPGENSVAQPILYRIRLLAQTAAGSTILPIGAQIVNIFLANSTANAVTGGLKFGTTSGAADIVAAQAVGANATTFVADASFLLRYFSTSATQQIFFDAVGAWNSASVQIDIDYYV